MVKFEFETEGNAGGLFGMGGGEVMCFRLGFFEKSCSELWLFGRSCISGRVILTSCSSTSLYGLSIFLLFVYSTTNKCVIELKKAPIRCKDQPYNEWSV